MRSLRFYSILIILGLISINIFNCSSKGENKTSFTKTAKDSVLYLRLPANPPTLNPVISTDVYSGEIISLVFDGLISVDSNFNIIPQVAKRWEIKDSGKVIKFILRNDVYFHDGVKLTAKDVKFTYNKIMDPHVRAENKRADFKDVDTVIVVDDTTLIVKYKKVYAPALLSWGFSILPKHIYSKGDFNTIEANSKPIGSGPYKFVSWETNQRVRLIRNENYWGLKPKIKYITFKIIIENNAALNAFKRGDIYIYGFADPFKWKNFIKDPSVKNRFYFLEYYTMGFSYIGWNLRRNLFKDKNVRKALTFALNREEIAKSIYLNKAKVCTGPFYFKSWAYDTTIKPYKFSLDSAKYYLKKAGWKDNNGDGILDKNGKKFEFTILMTSGSENAEKILTIYKENLKKIGIVMNIQMLEWATLLDRVHKRDFDAVILGWALGIDPDIYMLFHSSQVDHGLNYVGYKNVVVDSLLEKAQHTFDINERKKMYHKVHRILHEEQPYTFLFYRASLVGVNKKLKNVHASPMGITGYYPSILEWELE